MSERKDGRPASPKRHPATITIARLEEHKDHWYADSQTKFAIERVIRWLRDMAETEGTRSKPR
jgi:hypothetical protein